MNQRNLFMLGAIVVIIFLLYQSHVRENFEGCACNCRSESDHMNEQIQHHFGELNPHLHRITTNISRQEALINYKFWVTHLLEEIAKPLNQTLCKNIHGTIRVIIDIIRQNHLNRKDTEAIDMELAHRFNYKEGREIHNKVKTILHQCEPLLKANNDQPKNVK